MPHRKPPVREPSPKSTRKRTGGDVPIENPDNPTNSDTGYKASTLYKTERTYGVQVMGKGPDGQTNWNDLSVMDKYFFDDHEPKYRSGFMLWPGAITHVWLADGPESPILILEIRRAANDKAMMLFAYFYNLCDIVKWMDEKKAKYVDGIKLSGLNGSNYLLSTHFQIMYVDAVVGPPVHPDWCRGSFVTSSVFCTTTKPKIQDLAGKNGKCILRGAVFKKAIQGKYVEFRKHETPPEISDEEQDSPAEPSDDGENELDMDETDSDELLE